MTLRAGRNHDDGYGRIPSPVDRGKVGEKWTGAASPLRDAAPLGNDLACLLERIAAAYPTLPPQMRRIARDVERHVSTLAIDRIQEIAERCVVQPSAVVRFAQFFGYDGFRAFREVFRVSARALPSDQQPVGDSWITRLAELSRQTRSALNVWQRALDMDGLLRACDRLQQAGRIRIVGTPDGMAASTYALCELLELGRSVEIVTSLNHGGQFHYSDDVWLVISLRGECPFLDKAVSRLASAGVSAIVITDTGATWRSDATRDVLTVPALGGLDFDGTMGAIMLCGAMFAQFEHAYRR